MKLDELEVYRVAMSIGERVWRIVDEWQWLEKDSVGKQWIRAADSMAANLSEGYGRFFYKENRQFAYYARGSLFETATWLEKAKSRNLMQNEDYTFLRKQLDDLAVRLNYYIRSIGNKEQTVNESETAYCSKASPEELPHETINKDYPDSSGLTTD